MVSPLARQLTKAEALVRAKQHEAKAQTLRAQAQRQAARAAQYERWARKWYDWADDEYDTVPYPGPQHGATR